MFINAYSQKRYEMKLTTIEENVLKCIRMDGECLNDSGSLLLHTYWTEIDKVMIFDKKTGTYMDKKYRLNEETPPDSILRARKKLITKKANFSREERELC
jgi:hypothetical protein